MEKGRRLIHFSSDRWGDKNNEQTAKFELGNPVRFLHEPDKQFVIVRRDYRPHSGNWHYLLRGDKWRIEDDLSLVSGKEK